MTDTEAMRIVAEAMGYTYLDRDIGDDWIYVIIPDGSEIVFGPTRNGNQEQKVREWARDNLTYAELRRAGTIACGFPACPTDVFEIKTGDLTRAVAQVISERKGGDAA